MSVSIGTTRVQLKNLRRIAAFGGVAFRRDGRFTGTGLHVRVVDQLVSLGLVSRTPACDGLGFPNGHDYHITEAGWEEINAHKAPAPVEPLRRVAREEDVSLAMAHLGGTAKERS